MTYDITIRKQGSTLPTIEGILAPDALAAIAIVEKQYKQTIVQILGPDGTVTAENLWTGFEFEARQLDFSLS